MNYDNDKQTKLFKEFEELEKYCARRVDYLNGLDARMDGFSLIFMARMVAFSGLAVKYGLQSIQYLRWGRLAADSIKNGWTFLKASAQSQVRAIPLAKTVAGSGKAITKGVGSTAMKLSAGLSVVFVVWDAYDMIDSAVDLGQGNKHALSRELSKVRRELQEQYDAVVKQMEKQGIMQG